MMAAIGVFSSIAAFVGLMPVLMCGDHEYERVARGIGTCVVLFNVVIATVAWSSL